MYNYLILGLLQILFSFNSENVPPQEAGIGTATENTKNTEVTFFNDDLVFEDELYTILLRVDKQKNEDYQMSIEMHLKKTRTLFHLMKEAILQESLLWYFRNLIN
jgi:hypothetical protein